MSAAAERSVLHVLPHPGGGGETYVDLLDGMPGYRFGRAYLAASSSSSPPRAVRGALDVLRRARSYDLLHVHGEAASALCLPALATRPSVVTLHGLHLVRRTTGIRRRCAVLNLRAILRAANCTICVSESEQRELMDALGSAGGSIVIRNGVRIPPPTDASERLSMRESLGISPSDTVAIWVGSLDERKDPLAATRAAEEAQVTLLVVGDGPLRADVERAASEHVRVLGPRADVDRLLGAVNIFVLTSHREGLSFSLLEAMAHGLAPVVTDLPENCEAIGDAGVVIQMDDASLSSALRYLADKPDERIQLGERSSRRVSELFSAAEMMRETHEVYDGVIAERR